MSAPFDPIAEIEAISPRALLICQEVAGDGIPIIPAHVYDAATLFRDGGEGIGEPHPSIAKRLHNLAARWAVLHRDVKTGGAA